MDDTVLTAKVKAAIFNEPTLKSTEINIETLKGIVEWLLQQRRCAKQRS